MGDGPKQVKCSVCNKQVLKAQTSHVGNGKRACKEHANTEQQAGNAQQVIEHKYIKGRTFKRDHYTRQPLQTAIGPSCTLCGKEGIPIAAVYKLMLFGMEKISALGQQLDFLNMSSQIRKVLGIKPEYKVLFPIANISDKLKKKLLTTKIRSVKAVLELIFSMDLPLVLCTDCMKRHDITYETKPMPSLETLRIIGSAYETSDFKVNLQKLAKAQVEAERIQKSSKN